MSIKTRESVLRKRNEGLPVMTKEEYDRRDRIEDELIGEMMFCSCHIYSGYQIPVNIDDDSWCDWCLGPDPKYYLTCEKCEKSFPKHNYNGKTPIM